MDAPNDMKENILTKMTHCVDYSEKNTAGFNKQRQNARKKQRLFFSSTYYYNYTNTSSSAEIASLSLSRTSHYCKSSHPQQGQNKSNLHVLSHKNVSLGTICNT